MMNSKNRRYIVVGLMLFALLFGAGNLIFPAAMGQAAGENVWWALLGFCVTGVGLPLLGVMAMGYSGCRDLQEAAGRVHPWYGVFYAVISYLAIGPCFAAPRTGTVAFEIAVRPFLGAEPSALALPVFLVIFFGVAFWLSATPLKLADRIGKLLTPALFFIILALIIKSFVEPLGLMQAPGESYATPMKAAVQGVLDGYNTLDAIASVIFASLVITFIKETGVEDKAEITRQVYKSGVLAVAMLAFIYIFIAKIGAESVSLIGMQSTGAPVLAGSAQVLFGNLGAVILAAIVLLACLSTAVGLVTVCATYFRRLFPQVSYLMWVTVFTLASFLVGLFGLKTIITATVPVLMFIYPLVVALIALLFLHNTFGGRQCVYAWTMALTFVMALINGFETAGLFPESLEAILRACVPLHTLGLGWIGFAIAGFVIGLIHKRATPAACA